MQKFIDEIQRHPLVVALVVFGVFFVFYQFMQKNKPTSTAGKSTLGIGDNAGISALPANQDVYASQMYQYPQYNAPVVNQAAPAAPVNTTPGATQTPKGVAHIFNGVLGVAGSIHPANIGPWVAGRRVTYQGTTYTLKPGASGRLWGDIVGGQSGVLLWNGNDYAGGARVPSG